MEKVSRKPMDMLFRFQEEQLTRHADSNGLSLPYPHHTGMWKNNTTGIYDVDGIKYEYMLDAFMIRGAETDIGRMRPTRRRMIIDFLKTYPHFTREQIEKAKIANLSDQNHLSILKKAGYKV